MERELARHVLRAVFRSAGELQGLLPILKDHCSADEYEALRLRIASAIASIGDEVTNQIVAAHSGLADEVEVSINTYGRFL